MSRRLRLRTAVPGDAEQVALLHADSWRRHYRGAYADSYLDGHVLAERRAVWSSRLADPAPPGTLTIIAEDGDAALVGFVHTIFDADDHWGSLIDNLHVAHGRQRTGTGAALLTRAAEVVAARAAANSMYLWVLEQNTAAQRFYGALGGTSVETAPVPPPGGVPDRLTGSPNCLRIAWPDARRLPTDRTSTSTLTRPN
ncbi:GNAT family N-acetyltransferase [Streptacidiphilus carbonis]|uniref:GNAT family N-acetyltransferase n=1 Tax=Streptacidiphilus carbonis TaxID=105422 RepID=UPI0005A6EBD0|nr:GNAT family N-acetyltransferase [Streptacidiphilus carbonis]